MELITNKEALLKAIDSIATRGKKLDQDIHIAACSSLAHLAEHGDVGMVNRLYLALPKGARKAAMTDWLLKFASVVANEDQGKALKPFTYSKEKTSDLTGGIKTPWYDLKKDPAPDEVFDIKAAVMAVLKKAAGKDQLAHAEMLTALEALVADTAEEVIAE